MFLGLMLSSSSCVVGVSVVCGWVFPTSGVPNRTTTGRGTAAASSLSARRSRQQSPSARLLVSSAAVPNYCSDCGSNQLMVAVPQNDTRERAVCQECGHVVYTNPKIVVACVILDASSPQRCLLGQRAIQPRVGYWGFPQGFLEEGETTREAAIREVYEEFQLRLSDAALKLRAIYNVPGSVQIVYEARVDPVETTTVVPAAGTLECSAIAWFPCDQLPELCFPTVQWALDHCWSLTTSDNNPSNHRIQQKTKFFDTALDRWVALEDEPLDDTSIFSD